MNAQTLPVDSLCIPADVRAHMHWAAEEVSEARVVVGGSALPCRVLGPAGEMILVKLPLAPLPMPQSGTVVQVQYTHGENVYSFLTNLRHTSSNLVWTLDLPTLVERIERRGAERRPMAQHPDFGLQLVPPGGRVREFSLRNLSASGAAFEAPAAARWVRSGQRMQGALRVPNGASIPVEIEIRNLRRQGRTVVVGARFRELTADERTAISNAVESIPAT